MGTPPDGAFASHLVADLAIAWRTRGASPSRTALHGHGVKTAVTVAGAAVTLYAGVLGKKVDQLADQGSEGATEPSPKRPMS